MIIILNRDESGDFDEIEEDDDLETEFMFQFTSKNGSYKLHACHIEVKSVDNKFVLITPKNVVMPDKHWIKDYLGSKFWLEVNVCPNCGYSTDATSQEGEW